MNIDNAIVQLGLALARASGKTALTSDYILNLKSVLGLTKDYFLIRIGKGGVATTNINGDSSGTPDAAIYINVDGTTSTTKVWVDVNGTWTALTIS